MTSHSLGRWARYGDNAVDKSGVNALVEVAAAIAIVLGIPLALGITVVALVGYFDDAKHRRTQKYATTLVVLAMWSGSIAFCQSDPLGAINWMMD
jgi:hypothetical protein